MREIDRSAEDETVCNRGLFDKIVHTVVLKDAFSLFGAFAAAETVPNRLRADADDFRLDSFLMIFRRRLDVFGPKSGGTGGSGRGHRQIFDEFTAVHVHPFQLFGCFRVCCVIDRLAPFVGLLRSRHFQRDMLEP